MTQETLQKAISLRMEMKRLDDHIKNIEDDGNPLIPIFFENIIPQYQTEFKKKYLVAAKQTLKSMQFEFDNLKD